VTTDDGAWLTSPHESYNRPEIHLTAAATIGATPPDPRLRRLMK
jgi:hypothetical protein